MIPPLPKSLSVEDVKPFIEAIRDDIRVAVYEHNSPDWIAIDTTYGINRGRDGTMSISAFRVRSRRWISVNDGDPVRVIVRGFAVNGAESLRVSSVAFEELPYIPWEAPPSFSAVDTTIERQG